MIVQYKIENTTTADLEFIYQLFDLSIAYQEKNGYTSWKNYDRNALIKDVDNLNQYKIIIDSQIAMVFSICYADKIIWREREKGDALYLHRIVVNPSFKGQKLFGKILDWAIENASQRKLNFIRMDTWAHNPVIADYYKSFGFAFIENYTTPITEELPMHNRNLALSLLELKIK